jgi:hypothetical protein
MSTTDLAKFQTAVFDARTASEEAQVALNGIDVRDLDPEDDDHQAYIDTLNAAIKASKALHSAILTLHARMATGAA